MKMALGELSATLRAPASEVGIKRVVRIFDRSFKNGELVTTLKAIDSKKYLLALALENIISKWFRESIHVCRQAGENAQMLQKIPALQPVLYPVLVSLRPTTEPQGLPH